jgi:hypothetical protein
MEQGSILDNGMHAAAKISLKTIEASLTALANHDLIVHAPEKTVEKQSTSYCRVLENGIDNFRAAHPEIPVTWNFDPQYHTASQLIDRFTSKQVDGRMILYKMLSAVVKGEKFDIIKQLVLNHLPENIAEIIDSSEGVSKSMLKQGLDANFFESVRDRIEIFFLQQDERIPLSISKILPMFLEQTKGNLNSALYLMASFFKAFSRGSQQSTSWKEWNFQMDEAAVWFKTYIKDEYGSLVPYNILTTEETPYPGKLSHIFESLFGKSLFGGEGSKPVKLSVNDDRSIYYDLSLRNQVGKPYHAANLVALLDIMSPEMISTLCLLELLRHGNQHGLNKAISDLKICQELVNAQKLFMRYTKPGELQI